MGKDKSEETKDNLRHNSAEAQMHQKVIWSL